MCHFYKLLLTHKQSRKNHFTELLYFSNDLNISEFYTTTIDQVKCNITSSTLFCLRFKYSAGSCRTKHLKSTQQQHKITTENLNKRCKLCSSAFIKLKHATIKKAECQEYGCAIQVTSQKLIEQVIMKEKSDRFILEFSIIET